MAMVDIFLNNANDPSIITSHTGPSLRSADSIKIPKVSDFSTFVLRMAKKCHLLYKPMEKLLTLGIFIKSAVVQKDLKLGVVITWVISIVKKKFIATATCLEGVNLSTPAVHGKGLYYQHTRFAPSQAHFIKKIPPFQCCNIGRSLGMKLTLHSAYML